jgi:hypothetical protein
MMDAIYSGTTQHNQHKMYSEVELYYIIGLITPKC